MEENDNVNLDDLKVDDQTKEIRINICMECDHNNKMGGCSQCGCPISLLTSFNFKTCPVGKW